MNSKIFGEKTVRKYFSSWKKILKNEIMQILIFLCSDRATEAYRDDVDFCRDIDCLRYLKIVNVDISGLLSTQNNFEISFPYILKATLLKRCKNLMKNQNIEICISFYILYR
jgi:hypothetical protein